MITELLTKKLRPKTLAHLILPERVMSSLRNGLSHHLLMYGSPGIGKTSAALVMASGHPYLYINVSDESSVDIIRTKINDFCSTVSVIESDEDGLSKTKVIILDEIEGASDQFIKALRGVMDKFTNSRFIATTNYINKISEAIQSRFEALNFDMINQEEEREVKLMWKERIGMVISKLGMNITNEVLDHFVVKHFPDMRQALNKIQGLHIRGVKDITIDNVNEAAWSFEPLYKLLTSKPPDPYDNYQLIVSEYSTKVEELMVALGSEFISWIKENIPAKTPSIPQIIITVAAHQAQRSQVIDPVISMLSLCFTIQKVLS